MSRQALRSAMYKSTSSNSLHHSINYLQSHYTESTHSTSHLKARSFLGDKFLSLSSQWTVYRADSPFQRRVTCLDWHPTYTNAVAFGSKAGDVLLWKYEDLTQDLSSGNSSSPLIQGIGYGYGSITSMKFHPKNPNCMYTTSVDGTFCLQDFTGKHSRVFLNTNNYHFWWVSFDYCLDYDVLVAGDNTGKAVLLSSEGEVIKEYKKLHKGKIKHAEFCPAQSSILATSSVDYTVQLWDIRMLREQRVGSIKPITVQKHDAPISSSHFDPLTGTRLLTTSQNGQLRVYDSHNQWSDPTVTVEHAHRHFQHLTDITATWHPLFDNICIVGRYPRPDVDDPIRGIDLINLNSGAKEGHIYSPHITGIMSVSQFNKTGEVLASGEGSRVVVWKMPAVQELRMKQSESHSRTVPGLSREPGSQTRRKRKRDTAKEDLAVKKLKQKIVCETQSVKKRKK